MKLILLTLVLISTFYEIKLEKNSKFLTNPVELAITIDDLPAAGPETTLLTRTEIASNIIDTLNKYKIQGVYGFINGYTASNQESRLDILNQWKKNGHLLGNHTYSHFDLSKVTAAEYINDIERNENILIDYASSINELKYFRYPYLMEGENLEKRYAIRSYLKKRNYNIAQVTIDTEDWAYNEAYLRCKKLKNEFTTIELTKTFFEIFKKNLEYSINLSQFIYGKRKILPQILLIHFNAFTSINLEKMLDELNKMNIKIISSKKAINDPIFQEDVAIPMTMGLPFYEQAKQSRALTYSDYPKPASKRIWLNSLCLE